jgi:hypothetical protein
MKIPREAATALVILAAVCPTAPAQKADPLLQALCEARAAQAAREVAAGCYEFEEVRRTTSTDGKPSEQKRVYVVARKPGFVRIASPKSDKRETVYCENPSYTFAAFKRATDPFRLGHFSKGTGFGSFNGANPFNSYAVDYLNVVWPLTGFLGEALGRESSGSGDLKIVRVARSGSDTLVDYVSKVPMSTGQVLTNTGQARFNADLRLVAAKAQGGSQFEMTRTYNNRHPDGGPFTDFEESTIGQGPARIVRTFKYKMLDDPVPGDHEFYMSYYGLPEPVGGVAPTGPVPFWVWILAAVGCALLAYCCYRLARRGGHARQVVAVPPASSA